MKYPFVTRDELANNGGGDYIFVTSKDTALPSLGTYLLKSDFSQCKNITTEYLANTYGEVKSKEHAEFIKLLAETNNIPCSHKTVDNHCNFFYVIDGGLFFSGSRITQTKDFKHITIPLPPKEYLMEFEEREDEESNIVRGGNYKFDEWPKVGDEVCWSNRNHKAVVISLCDDYAWVKVRDGESYNTVHIDKLRKPKTTEQDLRDELISAMDNSSTAFTYAENMASYILSKYNITKKPQ